MNSGRKSIFTLIELLVVVAIISILFAMLAPALGNAKAMAKRTSCAGKVKTLAQNAIMYLGDYNDCWFYCIMPDGTHFWTQGDTYAPTPTFATEYLKIKWKSTDYYKGTVLDCPSKPNLHGYNGASSEDYMYSMTLTEKSSRGWQGGNSRVKKPTLTPVFGEIIDFAEAPNSHFFYCWAPWSAPDGNRTFEWTTHLGMDNFAFVDGHVAAHRMNDTLDKSIFVWDTRQEQ